MYFFYFYFQFSSNTFKDFIPNYNKNVNRQERNNNFWQNINNDNEIINLKNLLNNEKQKVQNLNTKINMLEKKVLELNQIINSKTNEINILKSNQNNNNPLQSIGPNEKILAINFIKDDQTIHYCLPCKNTELFVRVEERLYEEFPQLKDEEVFFIANGRKIKRFKTLDENNIKSGNTIIINTSEQINKNYT